MRAIQTLCFAGTAALALAGCQAPSTVQDGVINSQRQPILGGERVNVGEFPTVISLIVDFGNGGISTCTGTLITPRVVLTAAHCIDADLLGLPNQAAVTNRTFVMFDTDDIDDGLFGEGFSVNAIDTIPNPGFNLNNLGDDDIAIVVLEETVDDRTPSPIDLDPDRDLIGELVDMVGYGINDTGNAGPEFALLDKEIVSCGFIGGDNDLLLCYDQGDLSGKCNGDSGGPSFDSDGTIVGVTSFGDPNCTQFGADTRVSGELDFLAGAINPTENCEENDACNPNCGFATLPADPDCDAGRCSVTPASHSSSGLLASLGALFAALFVGRRRTKRA